MRTFLKHSYIKTSASALGRARAHIRYLQFRPGKDIDGDEYRTFFSKTDGTVAYKQVIAAVENQRFAPTLLHKLILSPGVSGADLTDYTRAVMNGLESRTGRELSWFAIAHTNTDNPHVHVIVLGLDQAGGRVFFNDRAYQHARRTGDTFLEHYKLLPSREHVKNKSEVNDPRPSTWLNRLVDGTRKHLSFIFRRQDAQTDSARLAQRNIADDGEEKSIGKRLTQDDLLRIALQADDRERRALKRDQKNYAQPIIINYDFSDGKDAEPVIYTWKTSIKALRELEREYEQGDPFVRRSMKKTEFSKLQRWIKDAWREEKRLQTNAADIIRIEVDFHDGTTKDYSAISRPDDLIQLYRLQQMGELFLLDHELYAVKQWLINQGSATLLQRVRYLSREESLEHLLRAHERGESWAIKLLSRSQSERRPQSKDKLFPSSIKAKSKKDR